MICVASCCAGACIAICICCACANTADESNELSAEEGLQLPTGGNMAEVPACAWLEQPLRLEVAVTDAGSWPATPPRGAGCGGEFTPERRCNPPE
eukprot:891887-Pleurochrysis_carterae.AAC.1